MTTKRRRVRCSTGSDNARIAKEEAAGLRSRHINIAIERETMKRDAAAKWLAKHDPKGGARP